MNYQRWDQMDPTSPVLVGFLVPTPPPPSGLLQWCSGAGLRRAAQGCAGLQVGCRVAVPCCRAPTAPLAPASLTYLLVVRPSATSSSLCLPIHLFRNVYPSHSVVSQFRKKESRRKLKPAPRQRLPHLHKLVLNSHLDEIVGPRPNRLVADSWIHK